MAEWPTLTTSRGPVGRRPAVGVGGGGVTGGRSMQSVREIVVAGNEEALNTAIAKNQIQPEKIISVMLQPAKHLAVGDYEAKYRMLYRL
jgi:hypothetical protein